jgi:hypothetical protein
MKSSAKNSKYASLVSSRRSATHLLFIFVQLTAVNGLQKFNLDQPLFPAIGAAARIKTGANQIGDSPIRFR